MPDDRKPEIVRAFDNVRINASGAVVETVIVRFVFGAMGPFELEVPRQTSQSEIEQLIDQRLAPFGWRRF